MPFDSEFYTIDDVAEKLKLDKRTVLALFEEAPGTICIERPTTMNKRRYRTFRIPHHVFERVMRSLSR